MREQRLAERTISLPVASGESVAGDLGVPAGAAATVVFAHGSGSGRHSSRNRWVAGALQERGFATLLFDLLSPSEEREDEVSGALRFDIPLLAQRVRAVAGWVHAEPELGQLPLGYFGASTGAAAALVAAAGDPAVGAIVSRGGRADLAGAALERVTAPTLLLVGSLDVPVIAMNREAFERLAAPDKELTIVPGASHLFEEPGKIEEVAARAADWFERWLVR